METVRAIEKVVARLRWRIRTQAALGHALLFGAAGLFAFALVVVLVKARVLETDWLWIGGALAIALPLGGIALGLVRRLDDIALATALDASGGLHSRLGSALAFARLPARTPMQEAAMGDALSVLSRARPEMTAPWRWGAFVGGAVALVIALGVATPAVFVFELPVGSTQGQMLARVQVPPPFHQEKARVRHEDEERLEALAEDLEQHVEAAADPVVKKFLDDLNELIRALQEGRLSAEEAHARLAALEKALEAWKEQHVRGAEEAERRLAEAAAKQHDKAHEAVEPFMEALEKKALADAAKALDELREKLAKEALSERDIKKVAKDLDELAEAIASERQKQRDRLKKERDRLREKREREKDRFAQRDRDRLKDTERQLEQLDDPQRDQDMSEAERQLERLSDELDQAAQDMLRRLSEQMQQLAGGQGPQSEQRRQQPGQQGEGQQGEGQGGQQGMSQEELERAVEALERMARNGQGRQQMRIAQGRMIDMRELMRRGQGAGEGQEGQSGKDGQGRGQGGEGGEDARRAFEQGARGQGQGKDEGMIMLGEGQDGGKGDDMLLLGGPEGGNAGARIPIPGKGRSFGEPTVGQDGAGEGHDPNLLRERTGLDEYTVNPDFVPGQHGEGESKTRVLMTAAQRGFATRAYRDVHQDYAGVVEDALEKEHIPPGKRTYVRRYFDLIRPR